MGSVVRRVILGIVLLLLLALPGAEQGRVLAAPGVETVEVPALQEALYHVVARGETLTSIARRYGTTVAEIARLNGISNPNLIYVGQRLLIRPAGDSPPPTPTPPPSGERVHVVRPGDTLFGIARRYGVTVDAIVRANGISNPNLIYVGQRLTIPGQSSPPPPPPGEPPPSPPPSGSTMGWGIQAHMLNEEMSPIVGAAREMKLEWLKQQIRWSDFEKSPGAIEWGAIDALVNAAGDRKLLFSVLAAPDWARAAGTDPQVVGPPADPALYAGFVGKLAERYCGKVQAIEVWNEQNLSREWGNEPLSPVRYMELLRAAYPAIKEGCADTIVVSGALTPTGAPPPVAMDDFTYLDGMYQNGLRQYSDAIGAHPSGYNIPPMVRYTEACTYIRQSNASFTGPCDTPHHSWSFRSTLEGTRAIMVRHGDSGKKIWVTEFGWAVGEGEVPGGYGFARDNSRAEQAAWTSQAFSMGRDAGYVGAMFLWNMNFAIVQPGSEQALWGIYLPGFAPTITVPAVRDTPH